jgi:hypothetical protein
LRFRYRTASGDQRQALLQCSLAQAKELVQFRITSLPVSSWLVEQFLAPNNCFLRLLVPGAPSAAIAAAMLCFVNTACTSGKAAACGAIHQFV